jgi:DNA processing protein
VFRESRSSLEAEGISAAVAQSIVSGCTFEDAVVQHQRLLDAGATLVPYTYPLYPPLLREIYDPPILLYARGRIELLQSLMLGVVGTRRPSDYGAIVARRLSSDLAHSGFTIVSGMARGIDTAAHTATLDVDGATIAVFGSGVDHVYPAENRKLARSIAEKGLLLSEFPMGTPGHPQNFPIRNRIISGMSVGVLIVEGAQYSGSAITARLALDQGREVFAVPGNITNSMSWGPNLLIKQGAKLVQDWNDVVVELSSEDRRRLLSVAGNSMKMKGSDGLPEQVSLPLGPAGETCRTVIAMLKPDVSRQLDDLVESSSACSSSEIIAALFELEMLGLVRQLPGKNFIKVWAEAAAT